MQTYVRKNKERRSELYYAKRQMDFISVPVFREVELKGRGYLVLLFSDSIGYSRLYFCC